MEVSQTPDMGWYWLKTCNAYCEDCDSLLEISVMPSSHWDEASMHRSAVLACWVLRSKLLPKNTKDVFICDNILKNSSKEVLAVDVDAGISISNGLVTESSLALCKMLDLKSVTEF